MVICALGRDYFVCDPYPPFLYQFRVVTGYDPQGTIDLQLCYREPQLALGFLVRQYPPRYFGAPCVFLSPRGMWHRALWTWWFIPGPQTTFRRPSRDANSSANAEKDGDSEKSPTSVEQLPTDFSASSTSYPKPRYISQLKIWHGSLSNHSFLKIFLQPIPFLFSPVVCTSFGGIDRFLISS